MAYHNVERMLRQEYNEPPSKILRDFAGLGYSKRLTAATLEINRQTLDRLARDYGVKFPGRMDLCECCVPRGKGWQKGKKRRAPLFGTPIE